MPSATYRIIRKQLGYGVFSRYVWRVWRYPERVVVAECESEGEAKKKVKELKEGRTP